MRDQVRRPLRKQLELLAMLAGALLAVIVPLLAAIDSHVAFRPELAVCSALCVPGAPIAISLRLTSGAATVCMSVALSLAFLVVMSTSLLTAGYWHPLLVQISLSCVALVFTLIAIRQHPKFELP
jgi:hypothetical protein